MMRAARHTRGYSLVEVMMALIMLTIGCVGVAALATTVVLANQDVRDFDMATGFARAWMDRLQAYSMVWPPSLPPPAEPTAFPTMALGVMPGAGWQAPTTAGSLTRGIDPIGTPIQPDAADRTPHYCAQISLQAGPNDRLLVARVRVIWRRTTLAAPNPIAAAPNWCQTSLNDATNNPQRYRAVYLSSLLRQNTAP